MDFTSILKLLPYLMQGIDLARSINNQQASGTKIIDIVRANLPATFDLFNGIGKTLFPELPQQSQVAAASVVLDTERTKKIQAQLNRLGANPVLAVDGAYGKATKTAVMAFQAANPPLAADGWAGVLTQKALDGKAPV